MSSHDLLIIVLFIGILVAFTPLLGKWLANVLQGKRSWLSPVLGPVERCTYRVAGVDPSREMDWKKYLTAVLLFNAAGFLILFLSLLCQKWLPLNPAGTENMRWDIALNTAISFMTNTNWQFYSGEGPEGISYFVQMTGLGVQNFGQCRHGDCRHGRPDPRSEKEMRLHSGQLLGGPDAQYLVLSDSDFRGRRASAGLPGGGAVL